MPNALSDPAFAAPRRPAARGDGDALAPQTSSLLRGAAFGLLALASVWAPVPLGSNRGWALGVLALVVWLGVCLAVMAHGADWAAGRLPRPLRKAAWLWGPALVLAGGVAVQQAVGHTPDVAATQLYLLRCLVYAGGMLLCLLAVHSRGAVRLLLGVLLLGGLLQAVVAAALYASGQTYAYFFDVLDPRSRASGTFINPDHLAGYLEITLAAGVGLMLALMQPGQRARNWAERLVALSSFVMSGKMLVRLALVLLVMALVLTRSRMGNGAFFIGIVLVGLLVALRSAQWRRPALWLVGSMLVVDVIVIGQWVGLDTVVNRLKGTAEATSSTVATFGLAGNAPPPSEESLIQRLSVPFSAMPLVAQKPLTGWGGGAFAHVFPAVKPDTVFAGFWDHAHNDYVQVAVDMGLAGLLLWVSMGAMTVWRLWPLLADDQQRVDRGVAVAALLALVCIGMHSLVDFNLHIPANALNFTVLLTLVWLLPALPEEKRRRKKTNHSRTDSREETQ